MTKPKGYYETPRLSLIDLIPNGIGRLLDVGCGTGATGLAIKKQFGHHVEVVGIEVNAEAASLAGTGIDKVIVGDVENVALPFEEEYFDCIIYGDVLEHLRDPWLLLKKHRQILKGGGCVVASIPNIAHYKVLRMLHKKEWRYENSGIMDFDHIRFFTINSIKRMFAEADLEITRISSVVRASKIKKTIYKFLPNLIVDDVTEQYLILAKKSCEE